MVDDLSGMGDMGLGDMGMGDMGGMGGAGGGEPPSNVLAMEELQWEALCQLLAKVGMVS